MRVKEWARLEGFNEQTVWQWCREDRMPVPFERTPTGTIIIHDPTYEKQSIPGAGGRTVCYARVSSRDQKDDLQKQADRITAFAYSMGADNPETVTEIGSGVNDGRRKLNRILADPTVGTIIVEHRDRLARTNTQLIISALQAQGRRIIVVDDTDVTDDLVRDMTEVLTSFCARLYGKRSARHRTQAALEAAKNA